MIKLNKSSKNLARAGIIGAIYLATTLLLYPISFGGMQIRVAEGLTLLPILFPESIIGLTVACMVANFFGNGILDVIFGTLATLIASILTYLTTKKIKNDYLKIAVGGIFPIILNALIVPFTFLAVTSLKELYLISAIQIFIGQFIAVYLFGSPVYFVSKKILNKK